MARRGYEPLGSFKLKTNLLPDAPRERVKGYAHPGARGDRGTFERGRERPERGNHERGNMRTRRPQR